MRTQSPMRLSRRAHSSSPTCSSKKARTQVVSTTCASLFAVSRRSTAGLAATRAEFAEVIEVARRVSPACDVIAPTRARVLLAHDADRQPFRGPRVVATYCVSLCHWTTRWLGQAGRGVEPAPPAVSHFRHAKALLGRRSCAPRQSRARVRPTHSERVANRLFKLAEIVGACDAMAKSGNMVDRRLDHVRGDFQLTAAGRESFSQIVIDPRTIPMPAASMRASSAALLSPHRKSRRCWAGRRYAPCPDGVLVLR